jgi:hypothetical protein
MLRRHSSILSLSAVLLVTTACVAQPAPGPPTSESPSRESASPAVSLSPTSSPSPVSVTQCEDLVTSELNTSLESNGWVSWNTLEQDPSYSPFDILPAGAPEGALSCRWGQGPEVGTDNVYDLAWAPVDPATAEDAARALEADGYRRIETSDGTYLALPQDPATGYADEDGLGPSFLFTGTDMRWAATREDLGHIRIALD